MNDENKTENQSELKISKAELTAVGKWIRLIYMVLFVIINYMVRAIIYLLAVVQFLIVLFTNKPNSNMLQLGQGMSYFSYQILRFLTYNTEEKPFPFSSWPSDKV